MVPAGSDQVSRARPYSGARPGRPRVFAYGTVTRCGSTFQSIRLTRDFVTSRPAGRRIKTSPTTPHDNGCRLSHRTGLGSSLFARHYSGSRGFFPFLRVLRCFSSPACLFLPYVFRQEYARITTRRFPHSEIPGSTDGQLLPGAYRSRPRPSSALGAKASTVCPCSLDSKEHVLLPLWSFQGARGLEPDEAPTRDPPPAATGHGLSKLNSVESEVEVDVLPGEPRTAIAGANGREAIETSPTPTGVRAPVFPRKEVIQPQLPLRLPCYDFTPIINPTFDGCLPEGLAHRLRVLPTFVV